jgi:crotonobetainyl-CoA:carnitine CoA-transferase CaiB-like acyl-CoA transferase
MEQMKHVLDGYKVLDFTQALAGPTLTRLMAEMGAEVIKVEIPPIGDYSRGLPFLKDGRSAYYVQQNRGKKSLCVDVKTPEGKKIIADLVGKVDVLVENFAPGVIGRMGLDYESVKAINPKIVMCSISAFGQTGPLANRPGYDYIAQAYAAVTYMIGDPNGAPSFPALGLGDVSTGVHGLAAVACALLYRDKTGRGQHLDISLIDAYFHCHEVNVQLLSASRGAIKPKRNGSQHPSVCPIGLFKGHQDYFFIMAPIDHQWVHLCEAMGKPQLAQDPRFVKGINRSQNLAALTKEIQDWLDSTKDDEEIFRILEEHRVPFAPVLSVEQAVNHPHFRERHTVRTINDRLLGEFDIPGMPLKFSDFPGELDLQAPLLGENNAEILEKHLGYTAPQLDDLYARGVLKRGDR